MKKIGVIIGCLVTTAALSFGQTSFSLVAQGTNNPFILVSANSTFTLTLNATVAGYNADGFSLWLQASNTLAPALSLTSFTVFQFPDKTQPIVPKVFDSSSGADAGFLSDRQGALSGDLGATANDPSQDFTGSAHLADYTFSIGNLAPGTYILKTTSANPKASGLNDDQFAFHTAPQALFTISTVIIPEPTTLALIAFGAMGCGGLMWLRTRSK